MGERERVRDIWIDRERDRERQRETQRDTERECVCSHFID